jgi:LytR cell envelope-related transcriptional attenuator
VPNDPGPPGPPGGPAPPRGHGSSQPLRAVLVVVVAVAIAVVVLARMGTPKSTASATTSSTAASTTATTTQGTTATTALTTTSTTVVTSSTTTTTVAPSSVTVLVLNGWTTPHAALYFQKKLAAHSYDTLAPENAATNTNKASMIYIAHGTAKSTNAYQIAGIVGVGPAAVVYPNATNSAAIPPAMLHQADIIVLVGEDISGQVPTGYAG